jgi:RNA polymerase sigma factor (sigma-70 family)
MYDAISDYKPIIQRIARSTCYSSAAIDYNDLCQVGEIAAFRAIKLYDPSYGSNIKSFVTCAIRREIYHEAAKFLGVFTVDRRVTALAAKVQRLSDKGHSDEEIAKTVGKTVHHVRDLRRVYGKRAVACVTSCDVLYDEDFTLQGLRDILLKISDNQTDHIILVNRILGNASVKDVARSLNLSMARVYVLENQLKEKIRQAIYE